MEPISDPTNWNLPQPTAQPPLNEHGTGQNSNTSQAPQYTPGVPPPNDIPVPPAIASATPAEPMAADTLSEKEWAERVKSVVERTKDDPWQQSKEVTQLRLEYLQKHHGKVFKVNE